MEARLDVGVVVSKLCGMSRLFGPIRQNGYVVRDIRAAMDHWIHVVGVGPWFFVERVKTDWFRHRGADSPMTMSVALANSGDLQIELIQQTNDAPSLYREFLDAGHEGCSTWPIGPTTTRGSTTGPSPRATRSGTRARSAASRAASPTSTGSAHIPAR